MTDILFTNARIVDGTGAPWVRGDVAVKGNRIAAVGRLARTRSKLVVDVQDNVLCPGFVDMHSHSDLFLLIDPRAEAKVRQGVTTEIVGHCGASASPLKNLALSEVQREMDGYVKGLRVDWSSTQEYFARMEDSGLSLNCAALVGHGTLRECFCGDSSVPATRRELSEMKKALVRSLREGAIGLSTGLVYPPSCYASTEEIVALCRAMAPRGGKYFTHMRSRSETKLTYIAEVIEIARQSHVPCHIAHIHGVMEDVLKIAQAREEGLDITFDQYPYTASSSGLSLLLPLWVKEGTREVFLARLKDPEIRRRLATEVSMDPSPQKVLITRVLSGKNKWMEGKDVASIAASLGLSAMETVCEILCQEDGTVAMVRFGQSEDGVRSVYQHPLAMVGSDGSSYACDGPLRTGVPHPRSFGTFVRMLGYYVRSERVLSLEMAVRSMTSAPAQKAGLALRGTLKPGFAADLVVLDPKIVADTATYQQPFAYPQGIMDVLVNGSFVVRSGERTSERPGKVLRLKPDGSVR